jgi:FkbM family methyltransferase
MSTFGLEASKASEVAIMHTALEAGAIFLRKTQSLLNRPYTSLLLRKSGIELREAPSYHERLVLRDFLSLLDGQGMIVYDIGANMGEYSSAFAKVRRVATVVAFEPIPEVFDSLSGRMRPYPHVKCFNVALGEKSGTIPFFRSDFSPSSSPLRMNERHQSIFPISAPFETIPVQVERLDDLVADARLPLPDLIKIDVQGFEDRVLRGGQRTIQHARRCVIEMSLVSLYEDSLLFEDAYEIMRTLNFKFIGFIDQLIAPSGQRISVDAIFETKREN